MRILTHALAAIIEIALLAAFACAGYTLSGAGVASVIYAALAVALIILLWGLFAAPKSTRRLTGTALALYKAVLFAAGTACFIAIDQGQIAVIFAGACVIYLALAIHLDIL